jgi:hypothetical protein
LIGSQHFTFAPGVTTPTGGYNVDRSLNIGRSYWSFDLSGSYTYFDPKQSTAISVTPGFLFNTQNPATHYSAGNEFHSTGSSDSFCRNSLPSVLPAISLSKFPATPVVSLEQSMSAVFALLAFSAPWNRRKS